MILKIIHVVVPEGQREEFVRRQAIWTEAMLREPGFLAVEVGTTPSQPRHVSVVIQIESRAALDAFMAERHDVIFEETRMGEVYEQIVVHVVDVVASDVRRS